MLHTSRLISAFRNSLNGLSSAVRGEQAVRQELIVLGISIPLAMIITGEPWKRVALIVTILFVLAIELLNTAIEKLSDHVTPQWHPQIGLVKDLASASVIISLLLAMLVWGTALLEMLPV